MNTIRIATPQPIALAAAITLAVAGVTARATIVFFMPEDVTHSVDRSKCGVV